MGLSRSRTLYLVLCGACATLALRPVRSIEHGLDWLLYPTRVLSELAAPLGWLQGVDQRVRDVVLAGAPEREAERLEYVRLRALLEQAVVDSALPVRVQLSAGVRALHAEVVARAADNLDRIHIRLDSPAMVVPGLPVVSGDWYVGVVSEVPGSATRVEAGAVLTVQLITDGAARIGGLVPGDADRPDCHMVVGGLAPREDVTFLDVHNPSYRSRRSGWVEVYEPPTLAEGYTDLANGFRLGQLIEESIDDVSVVGIQPGLDYATGLYQVLVLCPEAWSPGGTPEAVGVLDDGRWARARLVLRGEPSPWREGRKLTLGTRAGVVEGAALVVDAQLLGRVERAGPLMSDVRLLGDPGLEIPALAMIETDGETRPHVLGLLRSLGRRPDGDLVFEWNATLPIGGSGSVPARIWTGSGQRGLPRGLFVGDADLPCGTGTHSITVHPAPAARRQGGLRVRLREQEGLD